MSWLGLDPEMFAIVWETSTNVDDIAKKLFITKGQAYSMASRLRKKGVKLKRHTPRGRARPVDVDAINRRIASIRKRQ